MKQDFIKFADGKYAFTDESGKINLVKCDNGEDFIYILLCKEEELENLEKENRLWMNEISRIRENERNRRKRKLGFIVIIPLAILSFISFKPISLVISLFSSFCLVCGYKLFTNYTCGRKKDNRVKIDYAKKKYNENRDRIPELKDEIDRLKIESNYMIVNRDNDEDRNKYSFKGYGINREDDDVKIVHITRILSK